MSEIKTNQNQIAEQVNFKDAFNLLRKDIMMNTNCHAIATIQSFDKDKQLVKATMNYLKTYKTFNQVTKIYEYTTLNYPILIDCPVVFLRGGNFSLRFPITKGDNCLILFNDRDMGRWLKSGQVTEPETNRLHSFSDGIALVGLSSMQNLLTDFSDDHAELVSGDTKLGIGADKIRMENAATSLLEVINGLIDILASGFGANTPTPGSPLNPSAVTALNAYKTTVEGLLE